MQVRSVQLALVVLVGLLIAALAWLLIGVPAGEEQHAGGDAPVEAAAVHADATAVAPMRKIVTPDARVTTPPPSVTTSDARVAALRTVSGRVVRASDGSALADASVSAQHGDGSAMASTTAGVKTRSPDGSFELRGVPTGALQLRVKYMRDWPRPPLLVDVPTGADDVRDLVITFDSGFMLRGSVHDLRGAPIIGATVTAGARTPTLTDANGAYELRDVAPWPGVAFIDGEASAPGHELFARSLEVPADRTAIVPLDFILAGFGALEGDIVDNRGLLVAGIDIVAVARRSRELASRDVVTRQGETDAAGHYRIDKLPEGLTDVWIGCFDYALADVTNLKLDGSRVSDDVHRYHWGASRWRERGLAVRRFQDVAVRAGDATRLDAVLDSGTTITGRVTDGAGRALGNIKIGLYAIQPEAAPGVPRDVVPEGDAFHGLDDATEPQNAGLLLRQRLRFEAMTRTDDLGRYTLEHISRGSKRVITGDGLHLNEHRRLEIGDATRIPDVDFVLSDSRAVTGRVVNPDGEPVLHVTACVGPADEPPNWLPYTSLWNAPYDNTFHIACGFSGTQTLTLRAPGYATLRDTISPQDFNRTYVMQRALSIRVVVEDAMTHAGVAGSELFARNADEKDRLTAGAGGQASIERSSNAPCDLTVTAEGYLPQTLREVLPSSSDHDPPLVIRLQPKS